MIPVALAGEPKMTVNELKKYRLKKKILRVLYREGSVSGPELNKQLGVSLPTTLTLLSDLMGEGLVVSLGAGVSTGGRKPSMYGISGNSLYVIVCDMGRYAAKMAVFNAHNKRVTPLKPIDTHIDDPELVEKLYTAAEELIATHGIPRERIVALGVDMPGLVDAQSGINYTIKDRARQPVRDLLKEKFDTLVYVDNDARMQAFGEYTFGKARGCQNALIINWSWGLGLGMILNGHLYGGTTGFAGELSHIRMADDGELCICGKRGCLETLSSTNTILRLARKGISEGRISQLTRNHAAHPEKLTLEHVIRAARLGDEFSITVLSETGLAFGKGLSYLIQLLNPEVIVLGGPIAKANQFVLTPIQQALNRYCLEQTLENTTIVTSDMDEDSGLLGTTAQLYQFLFSDMQGVNYQETIMDYNTLIIH
jgi:predicted NBD/HSP70 family sugar kinase